MFIKNYYCFFVNLNPAVIPSYPLKRESLHRGGAGEGLSLGYKMFFFPVFWALRKVKERCDFSEKRDLTHYDELWT